MIWTLALRNLVSDRVRLVVALTGIAFAVLLAGAQLGLYVGASRLITNLIDHSGGDLWVMHTGTESFEEGLPLLSARDRALAQTTPGVVNVIPLVVSFGDWVRPSVGLVHILVVGADIGPGGVRPFNLGAGSWDDVRLPQGVAVDRSYQEDLGTDALGQMATIEGDAVRVAGLTEGLRSFTQTPYALMPATRARSLLKLDADAATFLVLSLAPGTDAAATAKAMAGAGNGIEVITRAEFVERSLTRWLMGTGAGMALIGGTILGAIIGVVIVAQILYSSTKDHIVEYATLRSIGSTTSYLSKVVLAQAGFASLAGFAIGMVGVVALVEASQSSPLPMALTIRLIWTLFGFTILVGALSSIAAIVQIRNADPASVFAR